MEKVFDSYAHSKRYYPAYMSNSIAGTRGKEEGKKGLIKKMGKNLNSHFSKEDIQMASMKTESLIIKEMQIQPTRSSYPS